MDIGSIRIIIVVRSIFVSSFILKYIVYEEKRKEHPKYLLLTMKVKNIYSSVRRGCSILIWWLWLLVNNFHMVQGKPWHVGADTILDLRNNLRFCCFRPDSVVPIKVG